MATLNENLSERSRQTSGAEVEDEGSGLTKSLYFKYILISNVLSHILEHNCSCF